MRFKSSFQNWIMVGCVLVVLCTLVVVGFFLERFLREQMVQQLRDSLCQQAIVLGEALSSKYVDGAAIPGVDHLADHIGDQLRVRITIITPDGRVLGDSGVRTDQVPDMEDHSSRPEVLAALASGQGWHIRRSVTLGVDFLYVAKLWKRPGKDRMVIRLALSLAEVERSLKHIRSLIVWASVLGVFLSVGLAILVSRHISRPIRDLTKTARSIASGDLRQRLRRYPSHEIGDLARAFDRMADHLQAEIEAATKGRDRLETILRGMVEGVMVTDEKGRITLTNKALIDLVGIGVDPLFRRPSEIIRNADLIEAVQRVSQEVPYTTLEITTRNPLRRILQVEVASLPGESQKFGVVAVFHDITDLKRVEEIRRDFVANVSHEFRTPLAAIKGAVETLLDGALGDPEFGRQFCEVIERHVNRLEDLVKDLLDLARLESKAVGLKREKITAVKLAESSVAAVSELAASRRVSLDTIIEEDGLVFKADYHQLEQALSNLLNNAIKYTEAGGEVCLEIKRLDDHVHLIVSDTGIGIPPKHLKRIFERFYRVNKDRSRQMGGTGLGLSIVKHVAQAHNGRVEVDSEPGRGSRFSLVLPV